MKKFLFSALLCLSLSSFAYAQRSIQNEAKILDKRLQDTNLGWFDVNSVSLYGGGSLLTMVTSKDESANTASPSGSLGMNFSTDRINSNLFFSYNDRAIVEMTTLEQFGSALMNPNLSGQSLSFSTSGRIKSYFGFTGSFQIADNFWKTDSITLIDASPMVARVGLYTAPFDFTSISTNEIRFTLNANFTHRAILGDFGNNIHVIGNQEINTRGYNGFDFSANLIINSVEIYFQYSYNPNTSFSIPGFSKSQILFGLNLTGQLIKIS